MITRIRGPPQGLWEATKRLGILDPLDTDKTSFPDLETGGTRSFMTERKPFHLPDKVPQNNLEVKHAGQAIEF